MIDKIVNYRALGERIQKRRQQIGLSQSDAPEKLDLSTSFYSRVERGEKIASLETLIKIAIHFELSFDFMLQDSIDASVSKQLQAELSQAFAGKTSEQRQKLVLWLKMLSDNIDILG